MKPIIYAAIKCESSHFIHVQVIASINFINYINRTLIQIINFIKTPLYTSQLYKNPTEYEMEVNEIRKVVFFINPFSSDLNF